jgi:DNA-binding response OmpR family regulator
MTVVGVPAPILVVEPDRVRGEELAGQLAADGYRVELARTVEHARILAGEVPPRLVLLGALDAPHTALALLEEIRVGGGGGGGGGRSREGVWDAEVPVLVAGASTSELDVLRAFEVGADDYAGGAGYLELRARLRAVMRRTDDRAQCREVLVVGALRMDLRARTVILSGERIDLRRLEFDLLAHLAREPRRVFARQELLLSVWGYRCNCSTRTVDSHASRLRRRLAGGKPGVAWIVSVRGIGYRLH